MEIRNEKNKERTDLLYEREFKESFIMEFWDFLKIIENHKEMKN